jgi:hypothetical protein
MGIVIDKLEAIEHLRASCTAFLWP